MANAVDLAFKHGVAGKVVNNGIAILAGALIFWHLGPSKAPSEGPPASSGAQ